MAVKITEELIAVEVPKDSVDLRINTYEEHGFRQLECDGSFIDLEPFKEYQYLCLTSEIVRSNNVKGILDNEFTGIDFAYRNEKLSRANEYALLRIIK